MHPAYSVIVFTTASGAGYGLLFLLGLAQVFSLAQPGPWFVPAALTVGLALTVVGLVSSTFHLGRPERAWRAFSQWRSSWLSREGVAAIVTFIPAGVLWLMNLFDSTSSAATILLGALVAAMCVVTVYCTAMIYASLAAIRQWNNSLVAPVYLALSLASGAVVLVFLTVAFDGSILGPATIAVVALFFSLALKLRYWFEIDNQERSHTMQAATGLDNARQIEAPHSGASFVMKEMGYKVARRHVGKLRRLAILSGFVLPAAACILAALATHGFALASAAAAVAFCACGLVIERWLFFGEAQHVVTLYYGEAAA